MPMKLQTKFKPILIDSKQNASNNIMVELSISMIVSKGLNVFMKDNRNVEKKIQTRDSKNAIKT